MNPICFRSVLPFRIHEGGSDIKSIRTWVRCRMNTVSSRRTESDVMSYLINNEAVFNNNVQKRNDLIVDRV